MKTLRSALAHGSKATNEQGIEIVKWGMGYLYVGPAGRTVYVETWAELCQMLEVIGSPAQRKEWW